MFGFFDIVVTKHAVERFKQRSGIEGISSVREREIRKLIRRHLSRGEIMASSGVSRLFYCIVKVEITNEGNDLDLYFVIKPCEKRGKDIGSVVTVLNKHMFNQGLRRGQSAKVR